MILVLGDWSKVAGFLGKTSTRLSLVLTVCQILAGAPMRAGCTSNLSALFSAAVRALPNGRNVPCDANHIWEIYDRKAFIADYFSANPTQDNSRSREELARTLESSFAFVLGLHYPIYVNGWRYEEEKVAYANGTEWLAYALAPLLAHERTHARGEARESVAHEEELTTAITLMEAGKLPRSGFDLERLKLVIQAAKEIEARQSSGTSLDRQLR